MHTSSLRLIVLPFLVSYDKNLTEMVLTAKEKACGWFGFWNLQPATPLFFKLHAPPIEKLSRVKRRQSLTLLLPHTWRQLTPSSRASLKVADPLPL